MSETKWECRSTSTWDSSEKCVWNNESSTTNLYCVFNERNTILLGQIKFCQNKKVWSINLFKRRDTNFLSRQVRISDSDRAKHFTEMILGDKNLEDKKWTKVQESSYYLDCPERGLLDEVQKRELLAKLNFDSENKAWFVEVRRNMYCTVLDNKIGINRASEVKELTEKLIKEAPFPYSYEKILNDFDKQILKNEVLSRSDC